MIKTNCNYRDPSTHVKDGGYRKKQSYIIVIPSTTYSFIVWKKINETEEKKEMRRTEVWEENEREKSMFTTYSVCQRGHLWL